MRTHPAGAHELVILGLGNVLCGDDSVGPALIASLSSQYVFSESVAVMDGGTLGLSLVPHIEDAPRVILVDAITTGAEPGSLLRLEGSEVAAVLRGGLSCHQLGVVELIEVACLRGAARERLLLFGIEPSCTELGAPRSARVEAAMPALTAAVLAEAARLGHIGVARELSTQQRSPELAGPVPREQLRPCD